jgi:hypothetical protein
VAFATSNLARFLESEAARPDEDRFAARNFLLDERASDGRSSSYEAALLSRSVVDRPTWVAAHQDYLEDRVFVQSVEARPPVALQISDGDPCVAETFVGTPGYVGTNPGRDDYFVHLENLAFLQAAFSRSVEDREALDELLTTVGKGDAPTSDVRSRVDEVLLSWRRDLRPCFATPFADVQDIVEDQTPAWANRFRDAAGLHHYDPVVWGIDIEVVLFRYHLSEVPSRSSGGAALVAPCVLDGRISNAFCPSPVTEGVAGRAVSLDPPTTPIREFVHAPIQLLAAHIFRTGAITSRPAVPLQTSRKEHLQWLRSRPNQASYAASTDSDLIGNA